MHGRPILLITRMITDRIGLQSVLLQLLNIIIISTTIISMMMVVRIIAPPPLPTTVGDRLSIPIAENLEDEAEEESDPAKLISDDAENIDNEN